MVNKYSFIQTEGYFGEPTLTDQLKLNGMGFTIVMYIKKFLIVETIVV